MVARHYRSRRGRLESEALRGLLQVWARECCDDDLRREALMIDYEL